MEKISIELNKKYFDELVEQGVLAPESVCVLDLTQDVPAHLYVEIKEKIAAEYDRFDKERKAHKETISKLYKQLDELQHGT